MGTKVHPVVVSKKRTEKTKRLQALVLGGLEQNGGHIQKACEAAKITRQAYHKWTKNDPEFFEKARAIIDGKIDNVEWALYKNAMEGHVTAQIFYLKNKRPEEWQDVNRIDARVAVVDLSRAEKEVADVIEKHGLLKGT